MPTRQQIAWLHVAQVVATLAWFASFVSFAPWISAVKRSVAVKQYDGPIPPEWETVIVNHGKVWECQWGTVGEHPFWFGLLVAVWLGCACFMEWSRRQPYLNFTRWSGTLVFAGILGGIVLMYALSWWWPSAAA